MFRGQFGPPWARRGWGGNWDDSQEQGPRFGGPFGPRGFGGPGFGPRGFGGPGFGGPGFGPRGFGGPHHHHHHGGWGYQPSPEQMALRSTAAEVARLFAIANRSSIDNPEKQAQLRAFLERSRTELSSIIFGDNTNTSSTPGTSNAAPAQETQNPNVEQA